MEFYQHRETGAVVVAGRAYRAFTIPSMIETHPPMAVQATDYLLAIGTSIAAMPAEQFERQFIKVGG